MMRYRKYDPVIDRIVRESERRMREFWQRYEEYRKRRDWWVR